MARGRAARLAVVAFVGLFVVSCAIPLARRASRDYVGPQTSLPKADKRLDRSYAMLPAPHQGIKLEEVAYKLETRGGAYVQVMVGRRTLDLLTDWWKGVNLRSGVMPEVARSSPRHWVEENGYSGWLQIELRSFTWGYDAHLLHNLTIGVLTLDLLSKTPTVRSRATIGLTLMDVETGAAIAEATGTGEAPLMKLDLNEGDVEENLDTAVENANSAVFSALTTACPRLIGALP